MRAQRIAATLIAMAGLTFGGATAQAANIPTVTIAWNKVAGQILGPVSVALGYDKEFGINLKLQAFGAGADSIQSVVTGDTDGAFAATIPVGPSLIQNGAPIRGVFIYAYGGDRLAMATVKASGITDISQLTGKRVAAQIGNTAQQLADALLVASHVDLKTVGLVNMDYPDMPAALVTHQVDAAVFAEPTLSAFLAKEPSAFILARGGKYVSAQGSFFMSEKMLKAPDDAAYKTYLTIMKSAQYIRQKGADSDEVAGILAKATGLSLALAKSSAAGTVFDPRIKPWILQQTQNDIDFFKSTGKLKNGIPMDQLFDTSLQTRALKEHPELFSDIDGYLKALGSTPDQMKPPQG
jgi:ABC-type nitrate/sulfonate/bicarbonate transport system substrate-binding protein